MGETSVRVEKEALCDGGVPLCERFEALRHADAHAADEICVMRVLTEVLEHSTGSTIMEVFDVLGAQVDILKARFPNRIGVTSGCELFTNFALCVKREDMPVGEVRKTLVERGRRFTARLERSRETIGELAVPFFRDDCCVLVHGYSRVVLAVLRRARERGRAFRVVCTESRPDSMGFRMAAEISRLDIPVHVVLDAAAAAVMDHIDFVLCGSQVICESGGIINKIGTYQLSLVAREFGKPFYVAAESFKFQRLYPLSQADVRQAFSGRLRFADLAPSFLATRPPSSASASASASPSPDLAPPSPPLSPLRTSTPGITVVPAAPAALTSPVHKCASASPIPVTAAPAPVIGTVATADDALPQAQLRRTWSTLSSDAAALQSVEVCDPLSSDYTDPAHITLIFTDFGVLTPSVVSDELIRMYS